MVLDIWLKIGWLDGLWGWQVTDGAKCFTQTRLWKTNLVPVIHRSSSVCWCGSSQKCFCGSCKLPLPRFHFPPFFSLSVQPTQHRLLPCDGGWGGEVGDIIVMLAVPYISFRAQWSGDLWVWLHRPRPAADPQCCGTQGRSVKIYCMRDGDYLKYSTLLWWLTSTENTGPKID